MNIIAIVLLINTSAHPTPENLKPGIYTQKTSKKSLNVLKLYPDHTYNFCRYKPTRIQRDSGIFKGHKRIRFISNEKKHGFNALTQKPVFKGKKGIYFKTVKGLMGGTPDFFTVQNDDFNKPWNFNPLTQKSEESAVNAQIKSNNPGAIESAKNFFIHTALNYAPGYQTILQDNYCGPGQYNTYINGKLVPWNQDTSEEALFDDLNTVIHESVHKFNNNRYLIIPGIVIPVHETEICKSEEFSRYISKDLVSQIFRYSTYVSKGSSVSSNLSGIYGIMDEFSAYMNGSRASLLATKKLIDEGKPRQAQMQLEEAGKTYFAWYEFRLFTAWYLHYTHQNRREIYNKIMENNNLRLAFTLIDDEFKKVILEAEQICINNQCDVWQKFVSQYDKYVLPCKKALLTEEKWLTDFKLQGAGIYNYRDYLTPVLVSTN
jgi:uncharacterized pyridoxamine 5'-phosphate oxidase family protein